MITAANLLSIWKKCQSLPWGKIVFSRLLGFFVPYSGTIYAKVIHLEAGVAEVELKDRRKNRNHLNSVHAMALANVGELATGLALISSLNPDQKAILVGFEIEYLKKARGTLKVNAKVPLLDHAPREQIVTADIQSETAVVAKIKARWNIK